MIRMRKTWCHRKMKSLPLLITCLSIARSEPPNTDYGTPLGAPLTSYGTPNYSENHNGQGQHDHHGDSGEPKSYEFGYQVKDDYTGTNYNRKESSDGNQVRGEYRVALPDGRTQIVTYWADWQSGFHADVKYEGEAQFPEQYNKGNGGYNNGGYGNGGYSGGVSGQYGAPGNGNGYAGSSTSSAINNLASHDNYNYNNNNYNNNNNNNYDSYNSGYNKAPPSNVYGPV